MATVIRQANDISVFDGDILLEQPVWYYRVVPNEFKADGSKVFKPVCFKKTAVAIQKTDYSNHMKYAFYYGEFYLDEDDTILEKKLKGIKIW